MAITQNARVKILELASVRIKPVPLASNISILAAQIEDLPEGVKVVILRADAQVFQVPKTGSAAPAQIKFTPLVRGVVGTVVWDVPTGTATLTDGTGPDAGSKLLAYAGLTTDVASIRYTITEAGTPYTDTVTVSKVREGTDTINAFLTNESHNLPADASGTVSSFTGAASTIVVYVGATDTTASWTITRANSTGVTSALSGAVLTVSAMSVDNGYVDITATRTGYTSIVKRFTLAKTKAGADGTIARSLDVNASTQVFPINKAGTALITSTALVASQQGLSGTPSWTIETGTATLSGGVDAYNKSLTFANMVTDTVTILVTQDGVSDRVTIVKVREGVDSVTALLTNESHTVATDKNGDNGVYTGAVSTMKIYQGATDDSANWTFARANGTGVTSSVSSGGILTVTGMTVDTSYVDVVASRSGYPSITKRMSISKARTGLDGSSIAPILDDPTWSGNVPVVTVTDGPVGTTVRRSLANTSQIFNQSLYYPIDRSRTYRTRFWARASATANGLLYFDLHQFTDSVGTQGPVNAGRAPYKPSGVNPDATSRQWQSYDFTWTVADWQTGVTHVQPDFLLNYTGSAGYWEIQDFKFQDVTEVVAAQTAANTANAAIAVMSDDNKISKSEKPELILKWQNIQAEATPIYNQGTTLSVITERDAFNTKYTALLTYMNTIDWSTLTTDIVVDGPTMRTKFGDYYLAKEVLRVAIAAKTSTMADWTNIAVQPNAPASNATSDVVLIANGNMTINGNTAYKSSGNGTGWDASLRSKDSAPKACFASAVIYSPTYHIMFGLNGSDTATDDNYTNIDYAIYLQSDGVVAVYQSGVGIGSLSTHVAGDKFTVMDTGSSVVYMKNGVVFYTSVLAASKLPNKNLFFDSSFYTLGAKLTNIQFGPLTSDSWQDMLTQPNAPASNATLGLILNDDPQILNPQAWSIGAGVVIAATTLASSTCPNYFQAFYSTSPSGTNTSTRTFPIDPLRTYDLTANLYANSGNDRSIYVLVNFYDSAGAAISSGAVSPNWGGTYSGYTYGGSPPVGVFTRCGGKFGAGVSATRPIPANAKTCRIGVIMQYSGAGSSNVEQAAQDIRLTDVTEAFAAQLAATAAQADATAANNALANIASDNILSPSEKPAVVLDYTNITNEQSGIDAQATSYSITTEKTTYDTAVSELTTYVGTLSGWNTIPGSDVTIVGTTFRTKFSDVYTARQALLNKIAAVAGTKANWSNISGQTNAPADNATADLSLLATNMTVTGNNATKTGGSNSTWDASVYSPNGFVGGAIASVVAKTGQEIVFGLNSDPTLNASYASIDYSINLTSGGSVVVYENSTPSGTFGTYVAGDVFSVKYDGSNITYDKNGTVFRTVSVAITVPLFFDSSVYSTGGTINGIRFVPMTSNAWPAIGGDAKAGDNATVGPADAATALGFNPQFSAWPAASSFPTGWGAWSDTPAKESSTVRTAPFAVKWTVVTAGASGMVVTVGFTTTPQAVGVYIRGSFDVDITNLNSGHCRPGYLFRLYTNSALTTYVDTLAPASPDLLGWQRVPFTAAVGAAQQIYGLSVYQMASYSSMPGGTSTVGSICIFDNLTFDFSQPTALTNIVPPAFSLSGFYDIDNQSRTNTSSYEPIDSQTVSCSGGVGPYNYTFSLSMNGFLKMTTTANSYSISAKGNNTQSNGFVTCVAVDSGGRVFTDQVTVSVGYGSGVPA